jgi:hypothetical protein
VREGRAEAYAAHAHRFGAAVTLTDTENGVVLLEMNGPFPVGLAPERPQQRIRSFEWGGPMGGVKRDVFAAGATDFAAEWIDTDGNRRLGGFVRFTGTQPGGTTLGGSSLIYRFTVTWADKASIDTGVDTAQAGTNDWTNGDLLEVLMLIRTDDAAAKGAATLTLNNDTGLVYDIISLGNDGALGIFGGTAVASGPPGFFVHGSGGTASYASQLSFNIAGYANTTFFKTLAFRFDLPDGGAGNNRLELDSIGYRSTSAITRVKIAAQGAAKLKVGSEMLVYKRVAS